jgi:predicted GH43/DUF377 family glycosyl hydrolase
MELAMKMQQLFSQNMKRALFLFLILAGFVDAAELIDLETDAQDFVLEIKQIHVPGFPGAFNASIIRWYGKLLLSFRVRDAKMVSTFEIGFVWLDEDFNPISTPKILKIVEKNPSPFSYTQDPRLIIVNNRLYMIYNNFIKTEKMNEPMREMFIAELHYEDGSFFIQDSRHLNLPHDIDYSFGPHEPNKRWEKNWVPFNYNENLLLARTIIPHQIVQPLPTGECIIKSLSFSYFDWAWGQLRGGTPALLDGDEYVSFFHSSKIMATVHSQGKKVQHYFMGAYTFSAQPPFELKRISPVPIVGKNFYHGPNYPTWKPLHVVFPMGILADENYFWVTYGRQDFEIWVVKIDKKGLYQSLVPCSGASSDQYKSFWRDYKKQIEVNNEEEDHNDYWRNCHANSKTFIYGCLCGYCSCC